MSSLPTDLSHTLLNGNISYSKGSVISQLSISFQNGNRELISRYRSIVAPNTKLELNISFYTEFSVNSGGRKGKQFLKDFVGQISNQKKIDGVVIS